MREDCERLNRRLILFHGLAAIGLIGYNVLDFLRLKPSTLPSALFIGSVAILLTGILVLSRTDSPEVRWLFAVLDFVTVLLADYVSIAVTPPELVPILGFSLIMVVFAAYADALLSAILGGISVCAATLMCFGGNVSSPILFVTFLVVTAILTYQLSRRLESNRFEIGRAAHDRTRAVMTLAIEQARLRRLSEINRLRQQFITLLTTNHAPPISSSITESTPEENPIGRGDSRVEVLAAVFRVEDEGSRRKTIRLADLMTALTEEFPRRYLILNMENLRVSSDPVLLGTILNVLIVNARWGIANHQLVVIRGGGDLRNVAITIELPAICLECKGVTPTRGASNGELLDPRELAFGLIRHIVGRLGGQCRFIPDGKQGIRAELEFPRAPSRFRILALPVLRKLLKWPAS